jgi:pimeloyl-ACP methyl ester carboxylesterase
MMLATFEVGGLSIAYARAGRGQPVVLLHNGGMSHAIWREVAPLLARDFEVFALDLLGFGASARPASRHALSDHVAILEAFVDAHGLAPVALVGNCMGSAISLAFAIRRPRDVRALVLINPLTPATFSAGGMGAGLRLQRRAPRLSRRLHAGLGRLRLPRWIGGQALRVQLGARGRARGVHRQGELRACYSTPGQMRSLLAVLEDLDSYAPLDRFVPGDDFPPIGTIWGLDNRVLPASAGRHLCRTLRPARQAWLAGCGHLPMLEAPEEVAAIILETLAASRPSTRSQPQAARPESVLQ